MCQELMLDLMSVGGKGKGRGDITSVVGELCLKEGIFGRVRGVQHARYEMSDCSGGS